VASLAAASGVPPDAGTNPVTAKKPVRAKRCAWYAPSPDSTLSGTLLKNQISLQVRSYNQEEQRMNKTARADCCSGAGSGFRDLPGAGPVSP